jgi:hypothetical protein
MVFIKHNTSKMKKLLRLLLAIIAIVIVLLIIYEIPQQTIEVKHVNIDENGIRINNIAHELIIQEVMNQGVWASRGFDIYFKKNEENSFYRVSRVPVPIGKSYALGSRTIRHILNKHEAIELLIVNENTLIVFAGGYVFQSTNNGETFLEVDKIANYGFGVGRGVLPQGYTTDGNGNIYWGEYWRNETRSPIRLMKSSDGGISWSPTKVFKKGEIRHIHAVQYDPFFDAIWVTTGDLDDECNIMYSIDRGRSFTQVGSGSQKWRAVSLMFGKEKVYWGMDGYTEEKPFQIWSWDRETTKTESVSKINSYAFYSTTLDDGTLVLSTDGLMDSATLWVCKDDTSWEKAAKWDRKWKNHFGTIRMESNKNDLILSNINLTKYNNDILFVDLK